MLRSQRAVSHGWPRHRSALASDSPRPRRVANRAFEDYLHQDSQALLARLRSSFSDETVEVRSVPNTLTAHGLHELAETESARLIVVGSKHTGRAGRVLIGSTAERLLHGSPCPVAVAPKGHAQHSSTEPSVIGCGYDSSESAKEALEAACRVAAATGARLRVIRVFEPLTYEVLPGSMAMGGLVVHNDTLRANALVELEAAVAGIDAEAQFVDGEAVHILVRGSERPDLLIVGSRGYGPLRSVLVGGVASRIVREAACPVIVSPRGADHGEDSSLFAPVAAIHR